MEFVEDKVALRNFPLAVLRLSPAIIPPLLHVFPSSSTDPLQADQFDRVINTKIRTICILFQQMLTSQKEFPSSKLSLHYGD